MKHRIFLFAMLLVCGISIPSLSGLLIPPFTIVPADFTVPYAIVLSSIFLLMSILMRYRKSTYWQIFFAFFVATLAILFDLLIKRAPTVYACFPNLFVTCTPRNQKKELSGLKYAPAGLGPFLF
jgi:hypothetical protein